MKRDLRAFLLDLGPASRSSETLNAILRVDPSISLSLRQESISPDEPLPCPALTSSLEEFRGDLLFLVVPAGGQEKALRLISFLRRKEPGLPVMAVLEGVQPEEAMEMLRLGVSDFLTPPLKPVDALPRIWRLLKEKSDEEVLLENLKKRIGLQQLLGRSPAFRAEMDKILPVSRCDASVLISGETGTGKEVFARAIHYLGPRAGKPFVPVSCGAIPVELLENELFGHARGAYTGAGDSQPGLVREAEGGTLFFDDMDCLSLMAQTKVLRLIQEKEYKPLGSNRFHQAEVRVIAATNVDLGKAAEEGRFRQDLFYRVNIIPLTLPPLRDRQEDIPLLAAHFLEKYASEFKKEVRDIAPGALQKLLLHPWPGNVRELEYVVERAVVFSSQPVLREEDLQLPPFGLPSLEPFRKAKTRAMEQFEKKYIQGLLLANRGNITRAARAADKNRRAFWELIRKHKIDVQTFKPHPLGETG